MHDSRKKEVMVKPLVLTNNSITAIALRTQIGCRSVIKCFTQFIVKVHMFLRPTEHKIGRFEDASS